MCKLKAIIGKQDEEETQKTRHNDPPALRAVEIDKETANKPNHVGSHMSNGLRDTSSRRTKKRFMPLVTTDLFDYSFSRYFVVELSEEARRCVNPYAIIEEVKRVTRSPPKRVFGNNRRSVAVEVETKEQSERMVEVKETDNIPCHVKEHPRYNYTKAVIYVHEFELENVEEFKEGLKAQYDLTETQPASFIKTKFAQTQIFILTFQQEHLPYSIYISGERQDTRVFNTRANF